MVRSKSLASLYALLLFFLAAMGALLSGCDSTSPSPVPTAGALTGTPSIVAPQSPTVEPVGAPTLVPTSALDSSTSASPSPLQGESESVDLYSTVVGALIKNEAAQNVYIIPHVGKGEHLDDPDESSPLPGSLLPILQGRYSKVTFGLAGFSEVVGALDEGGKVQNGGVLLTLGEIGQPGAGDNNSTVVKASIYRKAGDAEGYIYTLRRDSSGGWVVAKRSEEWNDK